MKYITVNKEKASSIFRTYTNFYDSSNIKISLKITHTYRVADISVRIAESIGADGNFAWLLGLLHDIGRFEQIKRFDTFLDKNSIDHAEFGADILFQEGMINEYKTAVDGMALEHRTIAENAIRLHNKLNLPSDLSDNERLYTELLRDADKADIYRVLTEPPFDERNERIRRSHIPASDIIMRFVQEHKCVPKKCEQTEFETLISRCCMAFDVNYLESRRIIIEQGYLKELLDIEVQEKMKEQMDVVRDEIRKAWGR